MSKAKVLVTDPFPEDGVAELREYFEVDVRPDLAGPENIEALIEAIPDYDGLVVRGMTKVKKEVVEAAKNLKVVARLGVSVSNIDSAAAGEKGIEVINSAETPEIAGSVSELVFAGLGALIREIPRADSSTKSGKWEKKKFKSVVLNGLLHGKTFGVIGYGRIGRMVAEKALAYHMNVLIYDVKSSGKDLPSGCEFVGIDKLLANSDVISLHIPSVKGPEGTENFLDAEKILKMKDGAVAVNTSRAAVWDEEAVVNALKSGKLGGVVVDVFTEEKENSPSVKLYEPVQDKVILTPHLGSQTIATQKASSKLLVQRIKEALE
ncbi:NAD(P)-dependent oxidoreductase [Candidatus Altiarchaeota archaeon]